MQTTNVDLGTGHVASVQKRPLWFLGAAFSALLIVIGFAFRTYDLALDSVRFENARQIGLPFLAIEIIFIFFAIGGGFDFGRALRALPRVAQAALAVFVGTFWVSSVFASPFPAFAVPLTIATAIHMIFALALVHLLAGSDKKDIEGFSSWMVWALAAFTLIIAWHIFSYPVAALGRPEDARWDLGAIPGFISLRMFGAYAGAVLALTAMNFMTRDANGSLCWIDYAALFLMAGLTVWSGTRAAVLGVAVALIVAAVVCRLRPTAGSVVRLIACMLAAGCVSQFFIPYGHPHFYLVMYGDFADARSLTSGRTDLWLSTLRGIADMPLFGAGAAGSALMVPESWTIKHVQPHNVVLQFFATWGLVGGLPALFLLGFATWKAHQAAMRYVILAPILAMLDCLLVVAVFDGTLYFAHHVMLVMSCYGIIFAVARDSKKDDGDGSSGSLPQLPDGLMIHGREQVAV